MDKRSNKPLVVAISGASGSVYGLRLVRALTDLNIPVALTLSRSATLVIREELGIDVTELRKDATERNAPIVKALFNDEVASQISYYPEELMTAPIASGSYPTRGMVIMPCSTGCFSKIANGISESLVERAAECMIKEGRKLAVVPRETPLSGIHLENLLKLSRVGVRVVPAMPAFYSGAQQLEELVDFMVGKVLDQFEIEHALYRRWVGSEPNQTGAQSWQKNWL